MLKKITYPQVHQKIENIAKKHGLSLTESQRSQIALQSSQLESWLSPLTLAVAQNPNHTLDSLLKLPQINQLCHQLFATIPQDEWFYLVNPQANEKSQQSYPSLFYHWLTSQPITEKIKLSRTPFTASEAKIANLLHQKQGLICSRDEIAQALWGKNWLKKYSDWCIDTLIHNLKTKLDPTWNLITIRNRGYQLTPSSSFVPPKLPVNSIPGTRPTKAYLDYMNNPKNIRQTIKNLLFAIDQANLTPTLVKQLKNDPQPAILAINSYSYDNVDTLHSFAKKYLKNPPTIYFTNFDDRALELHRNHASKLNLHRLVTLYDDLRHSRLQSRSFSLIINDFRLNFNTTHRQNQQSLKQTHRILKTQGYALISVVIDNRYESSRFGSNQQKAPLNHHKPWTFQAQEGLTRNCFTLPYYQELFTKAGFKVVKQFDTKTGKAWQPAFRRFLLQKI